MPGDENRNFDLPQRDYYIQPNGKLISIPLASEGLNQTLSQYQPTEYLESEPDTEPIEVPNDSPRIQWKVLNDEDLGSTSLSAFDTGLQEFCSKMIPEYLTHEFVSNIHSILTRTIYFADLFKEGKLIQALKLKRQILFDINNSFNFALQALSRQEYNSSQIDDEDFFAHLLLSLDNYINSKKGVRLDINTWLLELETVLDPSGLGSDSTITIGCFKDNDIAELKKPFVNNLCETREQ